MASTTLRRVPPQPQRDDHGCGPGEVRSQVGHKASQLDPGPGQQLERPWRPAADDLKAHLGVRLDDTRPNLLDEVHHAVDIGGVREKPEKQHGAAVRRRVRGARVVVVDVRRVGDDGGSGPRDFVEQAPFVFRAAKVEPIGIAVGPQLFSPQLAPIDPGVKAVGQASSTAGILPG